MTSTRDYNANALADYRIEDILVSPQQDAIIRADESFKMAPRALQLLGYLIEHAGRPINYNEVNEALWAGGCSENSFYQQIASLRKALGDNSSNSRYIKTIPKQGYMFIASDCVNKPQVKAESAKPQGSDASQPTQPQETGFSLKLIGGLTVIGLLLAIILWPNPNPRQALYDYSHDLQPPKKVSVIEWQQKANPMQQSVITAMTLLAQHHLKTGPDHHVAIVHRYPHSGASDDRSFYKKLNRHFSNFEVSIFRPEILPQKNKITLSLKEFNSQNKISNQLINAAVKPNQLVSALKNYETQLIALNTTVNKFQRPVLSDDTTANQWFISSLEHLFKPDKTRANLQQTIRLSQKAIDLNPKNVLAYSVLWAETVKLVSIYSDFDINRVLAQVETSLNSIKQVDSNYFRALLTQSDRYCWLEDYQKCVKGMVEALRANPYSAHSLDSLYWNLGEKPELQLAVAQYNYQLNPFYHDAYADYRDALFASGNLHEISDVTADHAQWSDSSDWFVQAQRDTNINLLKRQAQYYREHYLQNPAERQAGNTLLPSRYLGYSLLNANRPDLADFWARNGRERDLPYFDLRVIELLSDLWQDKWQPLTWQVERAYVMERRDYQNTLDKLTIAYFDLYSEWLPKAAEVLEELHPQLLSKAPVIDDGNLRLFVYYAEIQKRLNNLKYTSRINGLISSYLNSRTDTERGSDFGIADVEFYALNDNLELALDLLEKAVYTQHWLPNSLWLWPPLEHNKLLKSIKQTQRFANVKSYINDQLKVICFEKGCEQDVIQTMPQR